MKKKVIIDTDCGIDDAAALLLALSNKDKCELIAVTTCFGNTGINNVVENVKRVMTVCDEKNIPIHRGSAVPLMPIPRHGRYETVHGSDGLGQYASKYPTGGLVESEIPAVVALITLAKKYAGELNVIAIGPLTNLALAYRVDPKFFSNLDAVFIMGGNIEGKGNVTSCAEFNFYCDPEAAHIVLSQPTSTKVVLIPWETTLDYGIPLGFCDQLARIKTKQAEFFKDINELFVTRAKDKNRDILVCCDLLAVAACLFPDCFDREMQRVQLSVECAGSLTRGLTVIDTDSNPENLQNHTLVIRKYYMEKIEHILLEMLS